MSPLKVTLQSKFTPSLHFFVDKSEQRLIEQANLLRRAGEKEKEAKTLKDRAGSK